MRLDRLTSKFQLALADAQSLALGRDNQFIEPLHLMSALLNQDSQRPPVYCHRRRARHYGSSQPWRTRNGCSQRGP
ncbi:MAG: Clp protease N-terminal domain-containing protein, partial [Yersinia sp. (in: enterobacteria)]